MGKPGGKCQRCGAWLDGVHVEVEVEPHTNELCIAYLASQVSWLKSQFHRILSSIPPPMPTPEVEEEPV